MLGLAAERGPLTSDSGLLREKGFLRAAGSVGLPHTSKRRPKPYPLLNQPRHRFVEISHRRRYSKGRPRNYRGLN